MSTNSTSTKRHGVKFVGAVVGTSAVAASAALMLAHDRDNSGGASTLAGSGDAPTNTVYIQPTVGGMSVGATATTTTPPSVPPTTEATPPVKAGS